MAKQNKKLREEQQQAPYCRCPGRCTSQCPCAKAEIPCIIGCGCDAEAASCKNPSGVDACDERVVKRHCRAVLRRSTQPAEDDQDSAEDDTTLTPPARKRKADEDGAEEQSPKRRLFRINTGSAPAHLKHKQQ